MASLPQPSLFRHTRRVITEPDDFGDAVSGIDLAVDFQRRQERASQVEQFQSATWAIDFGEANVRTRVRGVLRGGWGSFCLALGPGDAVWNGRPAAPGTLSLLPPGEELDGRTQANYAWLTAAVPPESWDRCVALAGLSDAEPTRLAVCRLPAPLFERLRRSFFECHRQLGDTTASPRQAGWAAKETDDAVADAFTTACEIAAKIQPDFGSFQNRSRLARRAEKWMFDHLAEPLQVPDLCLALRVSRRELEYAFRTVFDQSPRDHLQALRLNAIRRALTNSDGDRETIITIAHDHGVTHLGRFAANYRALFGERPSETRRR